MFPTFSGFQVQGNSAFKGLIFYLTPRAYYLYTRAKIPCKTPLFAQFRCQAPISILEILKVFLWLKFSPSLDLNKIEHFSKVLLTKTRRTSLAHQKLQFRRTSISLYNVAHHRNFWFRFYPFICLSLLKNKA